MILDFPSPASTGTIYTGTNSVIYYYDGEKWTAQGGIGGGGGNADTGSWTFDTVTATTDGNIIVKAGSGADAWASLLSNNGANSFWVDDVGAHVTSNFIEGETTENYWTFGTDGILTLPGGNTQISNQGIVNSATTVALVSAGVAGGAALEWISDINEGTSTKIAIVIANSPFSATSGTVQIATGGLIFNGETTVPENIWDFGTDGSLTAPGHLLPNADLAHDLGSTSSQWRSIYVGTGTIYIGGVALGVSSDNYVTVDGNPIITVNTAGNLTVQGNTNIVLGAVVMSDTAPDATTPGSQWFNTVDGRTYIAYNGVWLDASPAQIPSPETYLDDIQIDGSTLSVGDYAWTFGGVTDTFPGDIYDAEGPIVRFATTSTTPTRANGQLWFNSEEGRTYIKYNGAWVDANPTQIPGPETYLDDIQVDGSEFLINGYSLTVDETGTLLVDGQQVTGGGSNGWQLTSGTAVVSLSTSGVLTLPAGSSRVTSYGQLTIETDNGGSGMYANATGVNLLYANTNVTLRSNSTGTTNDWTFGADGILTLSTASTILGNGEDPNVYIETVSTSTAINTWTFAADGGITLPNGMSIDSYGTSGVNAFLEIGGDDTWIGIDNDGAPPGLTITTNATGGMAQRQWRFGPDGELEFPQGATISETIGTTGTHGTTIIQAGTNDDLLLKTLDYVNSTIRTWTFGTDGTTLFPDAAIDGGTAPIELKSRSWSQLTYNNADMTPATNTNHSTTFYVEGGGAQLEIFRWDGDSVLQHRQWSFSNDGTLTLPDTGAITFPDATVQTTAYVAASVVNKTSGSWTLATGANTVSITVPPNRNYTMWVNGTCDNGIVNWNATVNVSNTNVPAIGSQYAWYYALGNALVLTAIPDQIIGTPGVISTSTGYVGNTANVFTFGITNNSTSSQVVNWGYTTL